MQNRASSPIPSDGLVQDEWFDGFPQPDGFWKTQEPQSPETEADKAEDLDTPESHQVANDNTPQQENDTMQEPQVQSQEQAPEMAQTLNQQRSQEIAQQVTDAHAPEQNPLDPTEPTPEEFKQDMDWVQEQESKAFLEEKGYQIEEQQPEPANDAERDTDREILDRYAPPEPEPAEVTKEQEMERDAA